MLSLYEDWREERETESVSFILLQYAQSNSSFLALHIHI